MSSLKYYIKLTRPINCLAVVFGTWLMAFLSDGSDWFASPKIAAALAMGASCLGASLFHYGAAEEMYLRKDDYREEFHRPVLLLILGVLAILGSWITAGIYLPFVCLVIIILSSFVIFSYAKVLSRHWLLKNIVIAILCTTPILVGGFSGNRFLLGLIYFIVIVFFAHYAREIIKDIQDIKADTGLRKTLPIQFGTPKAARIAGCLATFSLIFIILIRDIIIGELANLWYPYLLAVIILSWISGSLIVGVANPLQPKGITLGIWLLMISLFVARGGLF